MAERGDSTRPGGPGPEGGAGSVAGGRPDGVPRPPTREELDEISRDQALISDEWGSEEPPPAAPGPPSTAGG